MFQRVEMRSIWFATVLRVIDVPQVPTGLRSAQSIMGAVKDIILAWSNAMNRFDVAVGEGKAIDRLQQQLSRVPGFEEIVVDDTPVTNPEQDNCSVMIVKADRPSGGIQSTISHTVAKVNMLVRTRIHVRIVAHSKKT